MYQTIVVPIDIAQLSRAPQMLEAARMLLSEGGKIACLNVVQDIPGYVEMAISSDLTPRLSSQAEEQIRTVLSENGIEASVEVRSGHPSQTILAFAEEISADLVVVGSHQPGLEDFFLGSTASRVVRHAKCHVLVQR